MPLIQNTQTAISLKKQAAIGTTAIDADMKTFTKISGGVAIRNLNKESDADEIGKTDEFATTLYNVNWDVGSTIERYASNVFLIWAWAFALGNVAKAGTTTLTYTIIPILTSAGLDLPTFTYAEKINGTSHDFKSIGNAINAVTLTISSGPGRASCRVSVTFLGTGKLVQPSALTFPAPFVDATLFSASVTATIITVDYVAAGDIIDLTLSWANNIREDTRFFPGSGFQTGGDATSGAIGGRLEVGKRALGCTFTARLKAGSAEYAKLQAGTTGTAVISLSNGAETTTFTLQKVGFRAVEDADADGIVVVRGTLEPLTHPSNGLITVVGVTTTDNICQ